jgi:hypothetical protein
MLAEGDAKALRWSVEDEWREWAGVGSVGDQAGLCRELKLLTNVSACHGARPLFDHICKTRFVAWSHGTQIIVIEYAGNDAVKPLELIV